MYYINFPEPLFQQPAFLFTTLLVGLCSLVTAYKNVAWMSPPLIVNGIARGPGLLDGSGYPTSTDTVLADLEDDQIPIFNPCP